MKTKVMIECNERYHWIYMVYFLKDNDWIPVQYFRHDKREEAISYARDISLIMNDELDREIWVSGYE